MHAMRIVKIYAYQN